MNIVMVGARAFPIIKAGVEVCQFLETLPRDAVICTRGAERGVDAFIAGRRASWASPSVASRPRAGPATLSETLRW